MLGWTTSQALVHIRHEMMGIVMGDEPDLVLVYGQLGDVEFLEKLVQRRKAIATVMKWADAVLKSFYAVPIYHVARKVSNDFESPVYRSSSSRTA